MQVQNIQRPKLFSDFFNLELIWSNDYLEYIQTNNHNTVTSLLNNSKKSLKTKKTNAFSWMSNKSFMKDTQQRDCKPIQI